MQNTYISGTLYLSWNNNFWSQNIYLSNFYTLDCFQKFLWSSSTLNMQMQMVKFEYTGSTSVDGTVVRNNSQQDRQ